MTFDPQGGGDVDPADCRNSSLRSRPARSPRRRRLHWHERVTGQPTEGLPADEVGAGWSDPTGAPSAPTAISDLTPPRVRIPDISVRPADFQERP